MSKYSVIPLLVVLTPFLDQVLKQEFMENDKNKSDVNHIIKLIQYFFIQEQKASTVSLIRSHFLFHMIGNIHIPSVQQTVISLFSPGEMLLKMKEPNRNLILRYAELTNLFELLISQIDGIDREHINNSMEEAKKDEKVVEFLRDEIQPMLAEAKKTRNVFLSFFHSFFNIKMMNKQLKQPEEVFATIQDIDGIADSFKRDGLRVASEIGTAYKFGSGGTLNTFSYDDLSKGQETEMMDHLRTEEEEDADGDMIEDKDQLENMKKGNILMKYNYSLSRPMRMSKALRVFQKFMLAIIITNWLLNRKGYLKEQRTLKARYQCYEEKIKIIHPMLRKIMRNKLDYFEVCMKVEKDCKPVAETFYIILTNLRTYMQGEKMAKQIRGHYGEGGNLREALFRGDGLIFKLFWSFLIKIEHALENKSVFKSGYICGKLFVEIAMNM